jgi:sugar O-acyltransferase (sialic acid O-acetyltransferase NeuD family)
MMDVIIVGASGFGREVLQYVHDAHKNTASMHIKGFLDDDPAALDSVGKLMGVRIVGDTRTYTIKEDDRFIISLGDPGLRRTLAERLARRGARFLSIVHPTAYVAPTARIGHGCVISPFASVGSYVQLEDHVLLTLYATAGHDAHIGAFCVLSPYSVANGGSRLDDSVFLGTHAAITPNIRVGAGSKIAAGAVVYRDVPEQSLATGNPAKAFPFDQAASSGHVEPGARAGAPGDPFWSGPSTDASRSTR